MHLASVLWVRFNHDGQQCDLDDAVSFARMSLQTIPPSSPSLYYAVNNLSIFLLSCYRQGGSQSDLDEAISRNRKALKLLTPNHPDRSTCLNNFALILRTSFDWGNQEKDLDEAISSFRQALEQQPPGHHINIRAEIFQNLAASLEVRYMKRNQQGDLDEAISLNRKALKLRPPPYPDRSRSLYCLATSLIIRFKHTALQRDVNEAISLYREALELQLPSNPNRPSTLLKLGEALIDAQSLHENNSKLLDEAMSSFAAVTQCISQTASLRLTIARRWIRNAHKFQHRSEMDAYSAALEVLPQLAALSIDIQTRQEALSESDGLAQNASGCAIQTGDLFKAVQFLETERAIFWSQVLSLRSSFDQLQDVAPDLAKKLQGIATELELGSHRDTSANGLDNRKKLTQDWEMSRLNRLDEEWAMTINEVRDFQGFGDFLRPRPFSSLQAAASEHPVILLIANTNSSHCLIMTSTAVHHISLLNLRTGVLKKLVNMVQVAVSELPISRSFLESTKADMSELLGEERGMRYESGNLGTSDDIFEVVLKTLWDEIVKPVITFLELEKNGEMPVVHWCPTGLFAFLPVHAAGWYEKGTPIEYACDYFVSSYTPTIGTLLTPDLTASTDPFKMMVVIQSQELPSTEKELEKIERHVSNEALILLGVPGAPADVESVASRLSDVSIVHFACHGKQDRVKPLNSGLNLQDGVLQVSRIMKEKMLNGSLAFLCACETGMGDKNLPDEAMSLGASLLFSGFRRVIATMWEMTNKDGPTIADTFYEELFRGRDGEPALQPDTTKSAQALHIAVQKLRSQNISFRRWIPFIHMGK